MLTVQRVITRLLPVLALALPPAAFAQDTSVISGVVVDAQSGAPVADVLVTIQNTDLRTVTDSDGRFRVVGVPVGDSRLVLRHVGYGEHAQPVVLSGSGPLDFRIRISTRAIELSPVVVEVASSADLERRMSGNSLDVIDRATIEAYALRGETLADALKEAPGVRVEGPCVEYRLPINRIPAPANEPQISLGCRSMSIYLDGMPMPENSGLIGTLSLNDLESIQVLSPSEAGVRYGGGSRGVLLIETRRGPIAETPDRRVTVTGFGWNEPEPYRWLRVLGISAIGNAATLALTYKVLDGCGPDHPVVVEGPQCGALGGTVAAALTGTIGGMVTRWAGGTSRSEGRTLPSLVAGTATASIGYLLRLHADNEDSDRSRAASHVVLAVGMPLSLTLADRVFQGLALIRRTSRKNQPRSGHDHRCGAASFSKVAAPTATAGT